MMDMSIVGVHMLIAAIVIGAATEAIKQTTRRFFKTWNPPELIPRITQVFFLRMLPYSVATLLYVVWPGVWIETGQHAGLESEDWAIFVALFAAAISSGAYAMAKDWMRKRNEAK